VPLPPPGPDRTAIVTGASSGIGSEIARVLAERGHGVTLVARREDRLRDLADRLVKEHEIRAEVITADLTDESSRGAIVEEVATRGLTADILVNNAGIGVTGRVHESTPDHELAMIRTNVDAVVHLCTAFLPGMVERGRGAVLNVASTAAFQPLPGQAGYGASKAFVLSFSQATREELKGTGVTMTVLCPGPVETEFGDVAGFTEEESSNALPKFMWVSARDVAEQAVDGLAKGRAVVIPGLANRVGAALAHLTPRRILVPIIAKQHPVLKREGGS
jgi:short-subunit dehydrogenase